MRRTNLTRPENGKRIWREDAFDSGVISRADLESELSALGFDTHRDGTYTWYQIMLPEDQCAGRNMDADAVWIDLDLRVDGDNVEARDENGNITEFTKETLVEVRFVGKGNSRAYHLEDLWEGVRTQWLRMIAYGNGESGYDKAIQENCVSWRLD
tara:strand:- start:115 stop:579 length:465 start_codon:yes stop_codon:yes gene_type:complete